MSTRSSPYSLVSVSPSRSRITRELPSLRSHVSIWWEDHAVRDYASVAKRIAHPAAGHLAFDIEAVIAPHDPDQRLVVYTAEPNSRTARTLPQLASWSDDHAATS